MRHKRKSVPEFPATASAAAAGWFNAPGALDAVTAPMPGFAGELDPVPPAAPLECRKQSPAPAGLRIVPGADHFSFMNTRPPGTSAPASFDRPRRFSEIAQAALDFAVGPGHPAGPGQQSGASAAAG